MLLLRVPRWVFPLVAVIAATLFALAWWSFHFPLTYCDSPTWAPAYFEQLVGQPLHLGDRNRGWLVPAYFQALGWLSIRLGIGNLIGFVQATAMLALLLWLCRVLFQGAIVVELILLPALLLSLLRYAVYSQTIFSEPLGLMISVPVWLVILGRAVGLGRSAVAGAGTMLLGSLRPDNLYLPPVLLARILTQADPWHRQLRNAGVALLCITATAVGVRALQSAAPRGESQLGQLMVVAEWMRYTAPPQNVVAGWLRFDLVDRLLPEVQRRTIRTIYDGLPATQRTFRSYPTPAGWLTVARFVAYQCVNRPWQVLADRLATLTDLYASTYAAYWPEYPPWGNYYSGYDPVLSRWTPTQLDEARYSCPRFAQAQARYFQEPAVRSDTSLRVLLWLHHVGTYYAVTLLRPLVYLALPAALIAFLRRRPNPMYIWLTVIIAAHLSLRAFLVCADERYELPVDILLLGWVALTLRMTVQRNSDLPARTTGAHRAR